MPRVAKRYWPNVAGLLECHRSETGHLVYIVDAEQQGLDPAGGPYVAICDEHKTLCNYETIERAREGLYEAEWCEPCQRASKFALVKHIKESQGSRERVHYVTKNHIVLCNGKKYSRKSGYVVGHRHAIWPSRVINVEAILGQEDDK